MQSDERMANCVAGRGVARGISVPIVQKHYSSCSVAEGNIYRKRNDADAEAYHKSEAS